VTKRQHSKSKQDPTIRFLNIIIRGIKRIIGNRKLIIGLFFSLLVSVIWYNLQSLILSIEGLPIPVRHLIYWTVLLFPLLYLAVLGLSQGDLLKDTVLNAQLISRKNRNKKTYWLFYSKNNPYLQWLNLKPEIETALNMKILNIKEINKRTIQIIAIDNKYKMPTYVKWNDDEFISRDDGRVYLGMNEIEKVWFDLDVDPHSYIAGRPGAGKSVLLNSILKQMACKNAKLYMFDFKGGVEFGLKAEQLGTVVLDHSRALETLKEIVEELNRRLDLFRKTKVKKLSDYNERTREDMPRWALFIDEIGEMLDQRGLSKDEKVLVEGINRALSTIARQGRAAGIHMFLGTQRPDATVLTGQFRSQIAIHITGPLDEVTSKIVEIPEAKTLPSEPKGRFLIKKGVKIYDFQAPYFTDDDFNNLKPSENKNINVSTPKISLAKLDHELTTQKVKQPPKKPKLNFNYDDEECGERKEA